MTDIDKAISSILNNVEVPNDIVWDTRLTNKQLGMLIRLIYMAEKHWPLTPIAIAQHLGLNYYTCLAQLGSMPEQYLKLKEYKKGRSGGKIYSLPFLKRDTIV